MAILLKKQAELKNNCVCQVSFERTFYKILKFVEDKNISQ